MNDKERGDMEYAETLVTFFRGNRYAAGYIMDMMYIAHLLDDLIDDDNDLHPQDIYKGFYVALIGIYDNPFYVQYQDQLRPLMMDSLLSWWDSELLEHGDRKDKVLAFGLKNRLAGLINYCAYLCNGFEDSIQNGEHMRRLVEEDFDKYMKEKQDG